MEPFYKSDAKKWSQCVKKATMRLPCCKRISKVGAGGKKSYIVCTNIQM